MDNIYKNDDDTINNLEENEMNKFVLNKINDIDSKPEKQLHMNENLNIYNSHYQNVMNMNYKSVNNDKIDIKNESNIKNKKLNELYTESNHNMNFATTANSKNILNKNNNSSNSLFNDFKNNQNNFFNSESNYFDEKTDTNSFDQNMRNISKDNIESPLLNKINYNINNINNSEENKNLNNSVYSNMHIINDTCSNATNNDINNCNYNNNSNNMTCTIDNINKNRNNIYDNLNKSISINVSNKNTNKLSSTNNINNSNNNNNNNNTIYSNVNILNNLNNNSFKSYNGKKKTKNINTFLGADINENSEKNSSSIKKNCYLKNHLGIENDIKNKNDTEYLNYMKENKKSGTNNLRSKDKENGNSILENKHGTNIILNSSYISKRNNYNEENVLQVNMSNEECFKSTKNLKNNNLISDIGKTFSTIKENCIKSDKKEIYFNNICNSSSHNNDIYSNENCNNSHNDNSNLFTSLHVRSEKLHSNLSHEKKYINNSFVNEKYLNYIEGDYNENSFDLCDMKNIKRNDDECSKIENKEELKDFSNDYLLFKNNENSFNCDINDYVLLMNKNFRNYNTSGESNVKEMKTDCMTTDSTIYTNNIINPHKNIEENDEMYHNYNYYENENINTMQKDFDDECFNKKINMNNKDNLLNVNDFEKNFDFEENSQLYKHMDLSDNLNINKNLFLNYDDTLTEWKCKQNSFLKKENDNINPCSFYEKIALNEIENLENEGEDNVSISMCDMQKNINEKTNFKCTVGSSDTCDDSMKEKMNSNIIHKNNINKNINYGLDDFCRNANSMNNDKVSATNNENSINENNMSKYISNNNKNFINNENDNNSISKNENNVNLLNVENSIKNNSNVLNTNHNFNNLNNNGNIMNSNNNENDNNPFFTRENDFSYSKYKNGYNKKYMNESNLMFHDELEGSDRQEKNKIYYEKIKKNNCDLKWINSNIPLSKKNNMNNEIIPNNNVNNEEYNNYPMFLNSKGVRYDNNKNDFSIECGDSFEDKRNKNKYDLNYCTINNNNNNNNSNENTTTITTTINNNTNSTSNNNNNNSNNNNIKENSNNINSKNNNNNNKDINSNNNNVNVNVNNIRKKNVELKSNLYVNDFNTDPLNYKSMKFDSFSYKDDMLSNEKSTSSGFLKFSSSNLFNNNFNDCEKNSFENDVFNTKEKENNHLVNYAKMMNKENNDISKYGENLKDENSSNICSSGINGNIIDKSSVKSPRFIKSAINSHSYYSSNEKKEIYGLPVTSNILELNENINLITNDEEKEIIDPVFCLSKGNMKNNFAANAEKCKNMNSSLNDAKNDQLLFNVNNKYNMYSINNKSNIYDIDNENHIYNMNDENEIYDMDEPNIYDNIGNMNNLHENLHLGENNCIYNKMNNLEENNNHLYMMENNEYDMYNNIDNGVYNDMNNMRNSEHKDDNRNNLENNANMCNNLADSDNNACNNMNNIENNVDFILRENEEIEKEPKGSVNDKINELQNIINSLKFKNRQLEKELTEVKNMYLKKKQCLILNSLSNKNDDIDSYSTFKDDTNNSDCESGIHSSKYIQNFLNDKEKYNYDTKVSIQKFHLAYTNNSIGKLKIAAQRDISGSFMGPKGIHVKTIKSSLHISVYKSAKDVWFPGFADSHVFLLKGNIFGILRACQLLYHYVKSKMSSSKCCIYLVAPFECVQKLLADGCKRMAIIKEECGADVRLGNLYVQVHEGFTERLMEIRGNEVSVDCALEKLVIFMQSCFSVQSYDYELLKYPCRSVLNLQ